MSRDNRKFAVASTFEVGSLPPSGYVAWHEWAAAQHRGGLRQAQCRGCDHVQVMDVTKKEDVPEPWWNSYPYDGDGEHTVLDLLTSR